jgi:hypothetical protein
LAVRHQKLGGIWEHIWRGPWHSVRLYLERGRQRVLLRCRNQPKCPPLAIVWNQLHSCKAPKQTRNLMVRFLHSNKKRIRGEIPKLPKSKFDPRHNEGGEH